MKLRLSIGVAEERGARRRRTKIPRPPFGAWPQVRHSADYKVSTQMTSLLRKAPQWSRGIRQQRSFRLPVCPFAQSNSQVLLVIREPTRRSFSAVALFLPGPAWRRMGRVWGAISTMAVVPCVKFSPPKEKTTGKDTQTSFNNVAHLGDYSPYPK